MKALKAAAAFMRETLVVAPVRFYQKYISPAKPPSCRFIPTCSAYTIEAVRRYGIFGGGLMAVCRILRCNPLCRYGYDPVPDHYTLRPFAGAGKPDPEQDLKLEE